MCKPPINQIIWPFCCLTKKGITLCLKTLIHNIMPRGSTEAMIEFLMHFADLSDISSVFTEAKGLLSVRPLLKHFFVVCFRFHSWMQGKSNRAFALACMCKSLKS